MYRLYCLGHLTRHQMALEESVGEAAWQFLLQWLFYLALVSSVVKSDGPAAATEITFNSLVFSSIFSVVSLSLGQLKVSTQLWKLGIHVYFFLSQAHSLTTEYSTSGSQKVIYLLAAIGKPTHHLHFIPPIPNPLLEKVGRILSINLAIQDTLIKSFCCLQRARCQPSWCWRKSCWKV